MSQAPPVGKNSTPVLDKSKVATKDAKKDPKGKDQGPPEGPNEQTFWTRYSPHYEFPLSTVASVAAHAVVLVLLAILAFKVFAPTEDPMPFDMVIAGGGGSLDGVGNAPGDGLKSAPKTENVDNQDNKVTPDKQPDTPNLTKPDAALKLPDFTDSGQPVTVAPTVAKSLAGISNDARQQLLAGVRAGYGKGGSGDGGGKGRGHGRGEGDLSGDGKQTANIRMQRVLRWTMKFNTFDGDDYRKQLDGLGAILAVGDGHEGYLVIRDLKNVPVKAAPEDLKSIRRIFWIDNNAQSVNSLARALGLPVPREFIAFFPESLEKELLEKELAYKGLQEQDIKETTFAIEPGGGRYVPRVVAQQAK
jgi:hypothetical protein